ncbi:hypothetical protein D3C76_1681820 [compost metagenome]
MDIEHIDAKTRDAVRPALHRVRDIMHFQIEKHRVALRFQFLYKIRSRSIEKLHPHLHVARYSLQG